MGTAKERLDALEELCRQAARSEGTKIGRDDDGAPFLKKDAPSGPFVLKCTRSTKLSDTRIRKLCEKRGIEFKAGMRGRVLDFVGSDETFDRAGDIVSVGGWQLGNYEKNPVFLWAHDYSQPPIGQSLETAVEEKGKKNRRREGDGEEEAAPKVLRFSILFADKNTYPFADTIFRLYKGGFMNATSVGFQPVKARAIEEEEREALGLPGDHPLGTLYEEQELLELSAVPVPCNPEALGNAVRQGVLTVKQLGKLRDCDFPVDEKLLRQVAVKVQLMELDDEFSYRLRDPDLFDMESMERMAGWMTDPMPVDLVYGRVLENEEMAVQSVRFPKEEGWEMDAVEAWIAEHEDEINSAEPPASDGETAPSEEPASEEEGGEKDGPKCRQAGETVNDCVSRIMPVLMEEYEDQDQAVAVAMSMCREPCKGNKEPAMWAQMLRFDPERWDEDGVAMWAEEHGYASEPVQVDDDGTLTVEQRPIEDFDTEVPFEERELDEGVIGVFGALIEDEGEDETPGDDDGEQMTLDDGTRTLTVKVDISPTLQRMLDEVKMQVAGVESDLHELRSLVERQQQGEREPRVSRARRSPYGESLDLSQLRSTHRTVTGKQ